MEALKERILRDGIIADHNVLKVDSFLNHQIDVQLIDNIAAEFKARFGDKPITKVLTIETSGVAIAYAVARAFGVNAVFAKKAKSINLDGPVYEAEIPSYTGQNVNRVIVSQKFLSAGDHVLIVDDFLANGYAMQGLISIVESADATVEGLGIVIEKGFQEGGERLRNLGYDLQSLVIIESMDHKNGKIEFSK